MYTVENNTELLLGSPFCRVAVQWTDTDYQGAENSPG